MATSITWTRTVIAGETAPEDFYAYDERGRGVGRGYRQIGGHHAGEWFWCMNAMGAHINWPKYPAIGTEPSKQAAAERVRRVFERCLQR
jgi:hypothetical protein